MPDRHNARANITNRKILAEPAKLTRYFEAIQQGMSISSSASYAQLSPRTVKGWLKKAREIEPSGDYHSPDTREFALVKFLEKHDESKAIFEAKALSSVSGNAQNADHPGDWRAAAWLLERKLPREYAANEKLMAESYRLAMEVIADLTEHLSEAAKGEVFSVIQNESHFLPAWLVWEKMHQMEDRLSGGD